MESNLKKYQNDLESLIKKGDDLLYGLYHEFSEELRSKISKLDKEEQERIKKSSFRKNYNSWYNESLAIISQLMPSRYDDFISFYKQPQRKEFDYGTYPISDYLIDLVCKKGDEFLVEPITIITKFEQQFSILKSIKSRFKSSLFDIKQLVQADMFDSELDAAKELNKKGFHRAAGAICGVVIEKHLHGVCETRGIAISKKNPAINDYNELLKNNDVIDTPTWRFIQRLGDIRNLCDHNKTDEPTKENINDLIDGTDKIIKTIF